MSDEDRIRKYPNRFYYEFPKNVALEQAQQTLNINAQNKFNENSEGTDDHKDLLYEGEVFVRMNYFGVNKKVVVENDPDIKPYYMRLNDHNVYLSKASA